MSTELTRRTVLVGGLAAAGGGVAWWWRSRRWLDRVRTSFRELAGASGLAEIDAGLGGRYLELHPREADADTLLRLVFDGGDSGPAEMGARLAERIERDWVELDTVQLDGWIVARTEGRFLALTALHEGASP